MGEYGLGRIQKIDLYQNATLCIEYYAGRRHLLYLDGSQRQIVECTEKPFREKGFSVAKQKILRKDLSPSVLLHIEKGDLFDVLHIQPQKGALRKLYFEHQALAPRIVLCAVKTDRKGKELERIILSLGESDLQRDLRKGKIYQHLTSEHALYKGCTGTGSTKTNKNNQVNSSNDGFNGSKTEDSIETEKQKDSLVRSRYKLAQRKKLVFQQMKVTEKRLKRLQQSLLLDLERLQSPEEWQNKGDLLKSLLYELKNNTIAADDTRLQQIAYQKRYSPSENLKRLFAAAKKAKRGKEHIEPRLLETQARLRKVQTLRQQILLEYSQRAISEEELELLEMKWRKVSLESQQKAQYASKIRKQTLKRLPYRFFMSSDQIPILLGRSAKDNDLLTFKIANGKDFWIHAREFKGSHVIVARDFDNVPESTFLEAAYLAVYFSDFRKDLQGEVQYTSRKHLKKTSVPGRVHLAKEKVAYIKIKEASLQKLLKNEIEAHLFER